MGIKLSSFLQKNMNVFLYQRASWGICLSYMFLLGKIYYTLNKHEKESISQAVRTVYEGRKNQSELAEITKNVFQGILYHYYEKIFQAYETMERMKTFYLNTIEAPSLNKLDKALEQGRGALFITGHYGAIEYIPFFLALKKYPISAVGKFTTQHLKDTIFDKGDEVGLKILDGSQKNTILKEIMNEIKDNRIVFIECDEIDEWKPSKDETISFLRKLIRVDRTITTIQRRSQAEIIFGLLHRHNISQYSLIIENYQEMAEQFGSVASSTGGVVLKTMEKYIFSYPEEWYQWKNYGMIKSLDNSKTHMDKSYPIIGFRPAFGEMQ